MALLAQQQREQQELALKRIASAADVVRPPSPPAQSVARMASRVSATPPAPPPPTAGRRTRGTRELHVDRARTRSEPVAVAERARPPQRPVAPQPHADTHAPAPRDFALQPVRPGELHNAARMGERRRMTTLVDAGASANEVDTEGRTPLHFAAGFAHVQCVVALLSAGADINAVDESGISPLWCVSAGRRAGMCPSLPYDHAPCPGHRRYAAAEGCVEVVEVLLAAGANPLLRSAKGATPLFMAAQSGHAAVVRVLLAHATGRRALAVVDDSGFSPLSAAALHGHLQCVRVLVEEGGASVCALVGADAAPLLKAVQVRVVRHTARMHAASDGAMSPHRLRTHLTLGDCRADGWRWPHTSLRRQAPTLTSRARTRRL